MVLLVCYLKTFLAGQISPFILFYIISVWPSLQWSIMKTRFSKLMRKIKLVKFIANLRSRGKEEEKSVLDRLSFWEVEKTKFNEPSRRILNFEISWLYKFYFLQSSELGLTVSDKILLYYLFQVSGLVITIKTKNGILGFHPSLSDS